jgi:hypothetical protein
MLAHHFLGQFQSIHYWHVEIGTNNCRLQLGNEFQCLSAVARGPHHLNLGGDREHAFQYGQNKSGVIH